MSLLLCVVYQSETKARHRVVSTPYLLFRWSFPTKRANEAHPYFSALKPYLLENSIEKGVWRANYPMACLFPALLLAAAEGYMIFFIINKTNTSKKSINL